MRRERLGGWVLWVAVLTACTGGDAGQRSPGPVARPVRSVRLAEADSSPLGTFLTAAPAADGRLALLDGTNGRVIVYGADGAQLRVIGRQGGGPGELQGPSSVHLVAHDSIVAVPDAGSSWISLFEFSTGRFLRTVRVPGLDVTQEWSEAGDTIAAALMHNKKLLMLWRWPDSVVTALGDTPPELLASDAVYFSGGRPDVTRHGAGFVAALPSERTIRVLDASGRTTGTLMIPVRSRRGVPEDFAAKLAQKMESNDSLKFSPIASLTAGLHALHDGSIAFVALDIDQLRPMGPERPGAPVMGNERLYVSILSPDLRRACVDGKIPLASGNTAFPVFRGDTLFAVVRDSAGNGDALELKAWTFDVSHCDWKPTGLP